MLALRSLAFNAIFYLNLIVLMILGLPLLFAGRHGVFFMARLWGATSVWLLERICGLRIEYRGLHNIPQQGYILAAKHQSFLETFALLKHAPDFAIVLKRALMFIPVFGLYLFVSRQISIDRSRGRSALSQIIAQAVPVIAAGRQIFIFPEGTRRPAGAPPAYKYGVAALYTETKAPVLPVALNTGLFWGRRGFLRRPGIAVIEYLEPIPPEMERSEFARRLESAIEVACDALNEEAARNNPSLRRLLDIGQKSPAPKQTFDSRTA